MDFYLMQQALSHVVGKKQLNVTSVSAQELSLTEKRLLNQLDEQILLDSPPLFSPIVPYYFGNPKLWERLRCDVYQFMHVGPTDAVRFVSDRIHDQLIRFRLPEPFKFYPAQLRFKEHLYDYFVLQTLYQWWEDSDFSQNTYLLQHQLSGKVEAPNPLLAIQSEQDLYHVNHQLLMSSERKILLEKVHLRTYYDLIRISPGLASSGWYVSAALKKALEVMGTLGIEFVDSPVRFVFANR